MFQDSERTGTFPVRLSSSSCENPEPALDSGIMMPRTLLLASALTALSHASPVKSGHASAEWISGGGKIEGGEPVQTGIRLVIEEGWHTYWLNPGEAGNKVTVKWNLPDGWKASDPAFPAPKRFLTGELPGYGYEGEVIFPVTLTPPSKVETPVELTAQVSWLTCNDSSCVPGKADVTLVLDGKSDDAAARAVTAAQAQIPKPAEDATLVVRESGENLTLILNLPSDSAIDPAGSEVFPVTEQAVDHYKPFHFEKTGPTWTANATKNEYADGPLKELKLVLAKKGNPPVEIEWKTP